MLIFLVLSYIENMNKYFPRIFFVCKCPAFLLSPKLETIAKQARKYPHLLAWTRLNTIQSNDARKANIQERLQGNEMNLKES